MIPLRKTETSLTSHPKRGAVSVEFALVAPIVFLIFAGSLEFTAMNLIRQTAGNAAYEAARIRIVSKGKIESARAEALRLIKSVCPAKNVTVNVEDEYGGVMSERTGVHVTIKIPVSENSWGFGRFTGDLTIEKQCRLTTVW